MNMASDENQGIDEGTLEKIWSTLPNLICHRHRTMARNQQSTEWNIEELRSEFYSAYTDPTYFRRHIAELANRHPQLQVEGDVIRLTSDGLDYCEANIPGWQRDF
jgi:hypothetical protein